MKSISDININCLEGKLLMAALVKLTTESQTDKQPDEVLEQCAIVAADMYKDTSQAPETENNERPTFEKELELLINKYSKESKSNTPDYILAGYMQNSMESFHLATRLRDNWYGGKRSIINDQAEKWETETSKIFE